MGGERGDRGGGGRDPGPLPGKLQVVIYFQEKKTGTSFPRETTPPPRVGVVWIRTRMSGLPVESYFYLSFLHVTGLTIILPSADAQVDLRLCCLNATKSSFSQQGTY